jgi:putative radical SAM enzyme (TIGR03279 family)
MPAILASNNKKIPSGWELLSLDGRRIEDFLEFRFYNDPDRERRLLLGRNGRRKEVRIRADEKLDLTLGDPVYKRCGNDCGFCFVNGLPGGLRRELYYRDDDYRLSFLFGNFLSLTNLTERDRERIARLRLSPLYVSVHATDPQTRIKIFKNRKAGSILDQLRDLGRHNIKFHCQIVVMPGLNDGKILVRSIRDLAGLYPAVRSIGIVPVGVSRHLKGFRAVGGGQARQIIRTVQRYHRAYRRKYGVGLVYLADEFFIKAGRPFPGTDYYDDYPQYENGVGMCRRFLDELDGLTRIPMIKGRFLALTGSAAYPLIRRLGNKLTRLSPIKDFAFDVARVENRFFGPSVTVAGLLAGQDLQSAIERGGKKYDRVILPPDCVNDHGQFLDGRAVRDPRVMVAPSSIKELLRCLR